MSRTYKIFALALGIDVIIIDQLIKYFILRKVPEIGIFLVYTKSLVVGLVTVINQNIAFGLPLPQILIYIILLIIVGLLVYLLLQNFKANKRHAVIPYILIIAGAISNIIDRIIHGGVIDYLSINIYNFQWAVFNLADAVIVVGIIILIIINTKHKI